MKKDVGKTKITAVIASIMLMPFLLTGCYDDDDRTSTPSYTSDMSFLDTYALDNKVDSIEAQHQIDVMNKSDEIYDKISKVFGEEKISSIYFKRGEDFGLILRLKGDIDYSMEDVLLDDGTKVPITISSKEKYNKQEILDYMSLMNEPINNAFRNVSSMTYEPKSNTVVVSIMEPDYSVRELNGLVDLSSLMPDMNLEIRYEDSYPSDIATIQNTFIGGGLLNAGTFCTVGFTGTMNGVPGFLTATHCKKATSYVGNDGNSFSLNPSKFITDSSNDHEMSFYPVSQAPIYGGVLNSLFSYSTSAVKKVAGLQQDTIRIYETPVCHFGRSTGESCGYVVGMVPNNTQSNTLPNGGGCNSKYSSNTSIRSQSCGYFNKVQGPNLKCESGDSGGPVYTYDGSRVRATGIASSAVFRLDGTCDSFNYSEIYYAVSNYGFVLKTEY